MAVGKKYRGNFTKCLLNYIHDRLQGREDLDPGMVFVTHTTISEECHDTVMEAVRSSGAFETVCETIAGCTISCHCGPGTLGILFVRK